MTASGVHRPRTVRWDAGRDVRRTQFRRVVLRLVPTARSLGIATDDDRIADYVRLVYGCLIDESAPHRVTDHAELLTAPPALMRFNNARLQPDVTDDRRPPEWSSGAYLVDQCVWRSLGRDPRWLAVYGLAFAWRGRAALVAGPSGVGKTTLGLALSARGAELYGDEMILVDRDRREVTGLARTLTLRPGSIERSGNTRLTALALAGGRRLDANDETIALDPSALAFRAAPLPLVMVALAARGDGEPTLQLISNLRAALRLGAFVTPRPAGLEDVGAVHELLAGVRTCTLTLADPAATAERLLEELRA